MKNILVGAGVLVVVATMYFAFDLRGSVLGVQVSGQPIRIGGLFNQTGFAAFAGEASRNGFILAIEDAGLDPADFVIEDAQSDLKATVSAAQKLTSVDYVDVIIGPEWAEFSEVTVPVAESAGALVLSPWMDSEFQWSASPHYFAATPSVRGHVRAVLAHMHESKFSKVAIIASNNAWSNGVARITKEEIAKSYPNLEVVFESNPPEDSNDYRTDLTKLVQSDADAVFAVMASGTGEAYARQTKELGIKLPLYMPFSTVVQLQANGKTENLEGMLYPASSDYDRSAEFVTKYRDRFGTEPTALSAATTYDLTTLTLQAIAGGATSAEEISVYLENVTNYRGYSSIISFDDTHHTADQVVEMRQVTPTGHVVK